MAVVNDSIALAARAAKLLDYTTMPLFELCEQHAEFADAENNKDFCTALDVIEFCCARCSWWKPQIENATPDSGEWICQECVKAGNV